MRPWIGVLLAFALLAALATAARGDDRVVTILEGRVIAPDGTPVARALVLGTLEFGTSASSFRIEAGADGAYSLSASPPRSIRVFAYAPGYSNALETRTPVKGAPGYAPVVLRMRATTASEITVADSNNGPLTTATVTIAADSFSTEHPLKGVLQRVDARGTVQLANINDKDDLDLVVAAPGYLTERRRMDPGKPQRFILARGATVHVRVVDRADGKPVAGCKILDYRGSAITTDPRGRIDFEAPYGTVTVTPQCASYATDYNLESGPSVQHIEQTAAAVHDVRVRKTQIVTGRVVDHAGRPVAKAEVVRVYVPANPDPFKFLKQGPPRESATTDKEGAFTFSESSMDSFDIFVSVPRTTKSRRIRFADLHGPIRLEL